MSTIATNKKLINKAINILLVAALLLLLFNPDAKSWVLKQLISIGLFGVEIEKGALSEDTQPEMATFSFRDKNGRASTVADLKGKVVFINFWASWCPPCRAEMPSLNNLYDQLKDDERFVFLFVNEDNGISKAANYLQKNNFSIPFLTAMGSVPAQLYSGTLPTTAILNKEGKLVLKHEGIGRFDSEKFIKQLKELAAK